MEIPSGVTPHQIPKFVASGRPQQRHLREGRLAVDARDLLVANLDLIDRVVGFTCRRARLDESEAEEFGSVVKLKLIENDYAIIRKFEGRSSFSTFLAVVVQRMLLDYRIHMWGKWHPSAEAKRMGEVAVELEKLVHRDGRSIDEAAALLMSTHASLSREQIHLLAARLPQRQPRRQTVDLEEAEAITVHPADGFNLDRTRTSEQVSTLVRRFIDNVSDDDRLLLQLRFDAGMTVAEIARSMHLDQKQLYRRLESRLRELRAELERNGIAAAEATSLIGDHGVVLDFRLGNASLRPSTETEEQRRERNSR